MILISTQYEWLLAGEDRSPERRSLVLHHFAIRLHQRERRAERRLARR
jgi:hypothetical protein